MLYNSESIPGVKRINRENKLPPWSYCFLDWWAFFSDRYPAQSVVRCLRNDDSPRSRAPSCSETHPAYLWRRGFSAQRNRRIGGDQPCLTGSESRSVVSGPGGCIDRHVGESISGPPAHRSGNKKRYSDHCRVDRDV